VGPGPIPTGQRDAVVPQDTAGRSGDASVVFTSCADGDLGQTSGCPDGRRREVVDLPWSVPRQVHGARVVEVVEPGQVSGEEADALVTTRPGLALAVLTADCAPVAFTTPEGIIGVAHAGWRGLQAGVLEATVSLLREMGASRVHASLGPCIHPCCYQFGSEDLRHLVGRFGPTVIGTDRSGHAALDVPAAVRSALGLAGVEQSDDVDVCTACSDRHWSWRARSDTARQATVVWR
jgi:YfiH family protein